MFTGLEALLRSDKIECEVLGVTEIRFELLIYPVVDVLYLRYDEARVATQQTINNF